MIEQGVMMNQQQQQPLMNMNHNLMSMNQMTQPQPQMPPMNRSYGVWPPPSQFQSSKSAVGGVKPSLTGFKKSLGPRNNWKGKKSSNLTEKRRNDQLKALMAGSLPGNVNMMEVGGLGNPEITSYQPPSLSELQHHNRLKTGRYFQKKKFNKSGVVNMGMGGNSNYRLGDDMSAPFAPRNTTSFIIRAKKSGGIAPLVSPSPMTPAIIPTPIFSPSREVVVDMAKEEWGVDGYGSMKGFIRLRPQGHEMETNEDEEEDGGSSSESDGEGHVEVTRRFDHDLSRFEMIYDPTKNNPSVLDQHYVLENRVDDHDSHIAQLEEENLILKERLFLMEREFEDLRRRMQCLEQKEKRGEIESTLYNDSDNEIESRVEPEDNDNLIRENDVMSAVQPHEIPDNDKLDATTVAERNEADEDLEPLNHNIEHGDAAGL